MSHQTRGADNYFIRVLQMRKKEDLLRATWYEDQVWPDSQPGHALSSWVEEEEEGDQEVEGGIMA